GHACVDERACRAHASRTSDRRSRRHRLQRAPFRSAQSQRSFGGAARCTSERSSEDPARASAALGGSRSGGGLRSAIVGAHAWRPVLAVESLRALPAAIHRGVESAEEPVGVHESRYRILGAAQAVWRALRNHADSARAGLKDIFCSYFSIRYSIPALVSSGPRCVCTASASDSL